MNQQYGSSGYLIDGWYLDNQNARCTVPAVTAALDVSNISSNDDIGLVACYGPDPKPAITTDPTAPADDSGAGAAAAAVLGGVAIGGAAYLVGTQLWMETNLPGGVIPTSREQLALMLWNAAGKPGLQPVALYSDVDAANTDAQQAARWCVEQGLMKDFNEGTAFRPGDYAFRPQVIKAWNDLRRLSPAE